MAVTAAAAVALSSCGSDTSSALPRCTSYERLGLVAQSVPTASYLPCLSSLPEGWRVVHFDSHRGGTDISLLSDRAAGRRVEVKLRGGCDATGSTAEPPRADGVRTYLRVDSVSPSYRGTLYDVFPGGCVTYGFDFVRGPHIPLIEQFEAAVQLTSRREVRLHVERDIGTELDP